MNIQRYLLSPRSLMHLWTCQHEHNVTAIRETATDASKLDAVKRSTKLPHNPRVYVGCCRTRGPHTLESQLLLYRYLWMAHRDPSDEAMWHLASRGQKMWAEEAARMPSQLSKQAPQTDRCVPRTLMYPVCRQMGRAHILSARVCPIPETLMSPHSSPDSNCPSRAIPAFFSPRNLHAWTALLARRTGSLITVNDPSMPTRVATDSHACSYAGIGARHTGSLLLATSSAGLDGLRQRAAALAATGVDAQILSGTEAMKLEPLLELPDDGGALISPRDWQICGRAASRYLLDQCQGLGAGGRFQAHFGMHVERVSMDCCSSEVTGVHAREGSFGCRSVRPACAYADRAACPDVADLLNKAAVVSYMMAWYIRGFNSIAIGTTVWCIFMW